MCIFLETTEAKIKLLKNRICVLQGQINKKHLEIEYCEREIKRLGKGG